MRQSTRIVALLFFSLVLVVAAAFAARAGATYKQVPLSDVASWLAQRPVSIVCQEKNEPDIVIDLYGAGAYTPGYIDARGWFHPADYAVLAYPLCDILAELQMGVAWGQREDLDIGYAVLALTHESRHLRSPMRDDALLEARVECWAIRHVRYVALRLGVSEEESYRVRRAALDAHNRLPEPYKLSSCRLPG